MKKYYVQEIPLQYHIILSQGKGKPTKQLEDYLLKISKNVFRKRWLLGVSIDDQHDIYVEAFMILLKNWKKINLNKHQKALPYLTEIFKRGIVQGINLIVHRKKHSKSESYQWISYDYLKETDFYSS